MVYRNSLHLSFKNFLAVAGVALVVLVGCSKERVGVGDGGPGGDGGPQKVCDYCNGAQYVPCDSAGLQGTPVLCTDGQTCAEGIGCAACVPGSTTCMGNAVYTCGTDGKPKDLVMGCDVASGSVCADGACLDGCAAAATNASNVGCEFWTLDLDNESGINNAAGQPWGVVISNAGVGTASITIDRNDGAVGMPPQIVAQMGFSLAPGTVQMVTLPTREVDGSTNGMGNGPGTFLSSNAYRVRSDLPLVVYQFNPLRQSFSNGASLLIPANGLGLDHRIVGYPAGGFGHAYVTIVGTQAGTTVKFKTTTATLAGGGIPALAAGDTYTGTIGLFDVINIENSGLGGDFTGSAVSATAPVAVFTGAETALAPGTSQKPPPPPGYTGSNCCTDHIEEQVVPLTSLGKNFVITRSPVRSDEPATYPGYDIIRFVGAAAAATVTTNLAAPDNTFTLQPGQMHETFVDSDFTATSTEPIMIGQILVSGNYTDTNLLVGDPSLTLFPAVEQYRSSYLVLVPESYDSNYISISQPAADAPAQIDGAALPAACDVGMTGKLAGVDYIARRCPVQPGAHNITGASPFGITVYGYYRYGSYAFVGGAYVKKIYMPPPIL